MKIYGIIYKRQTKSPIAIGISVGDAWNTVKAATGDRPAKLLRLGYRLVEYEVELKCSPNKKERPYVQRRKVA
jgi:hypothetical protein